MSEVQIGKRDTSLYTGESKQDDAYDKKIKSISGAGVRPDLAPPVINATKLQDYYKLFFPQQALYSWTSLFESEKKGNREYSVALRIGEEDETIVRYLKWPDVVRRFKEDFVLKLDIGPIFNTDVYIAKSGIAGPDGTKRVEVEEKELVFDIDMDNYDGVRKCGCQGKEVCKECWQFVNCAVDVLNRVLREDFGFRHLLFVFSGRRGLHCWVCDRAARQLSEDARRALVSYINIENAKTLRRDELVHPSLLKAYDLLAKRLPHMAEVHNFLGTKASEKLERIKEFVSDEKQIIKLNQLPNDQIWHVGESASHSELAPTVRRMGFNYAYPKLDVEVSRSNKHLLKAPFCIHPSTGKVCVPLDPNRIDEFDPRRTLTIDQVLTRQQVVDGPSFQDYVKFFQAFVEDLRKSELKGK